MTAIDSNEETIRIARRTMRTDPYRNRRGGITYEAADFNSLDDVPGTYDAVLFSRVLHDMPHPDRVISRAHDLLKDGGRVVCLEYAYDRMDRRAAIWLYQIQRFLEVVGWYPLGRISIEPQVSVERVMEENCRRRKQHINRFEDMIQPLEQLFHKERFSWHSYYCWDIFGDMRIPD